MSSIMITTDVTVHVDEQDLKDEGWHHQDDCTVECACGCDGENENPALVAVDALHDWHESAHGYTLWSGCQQEPCNVLTLDYRKRS